MATDSDSNRENDHDPAPPLDPVDEALVDQIWQDVQGKVPRAQIYQLVAEARNDFAEATITAYISIFVRREVRKKVASMISEPQSANTSHIINSASVDEASAKEEKLPTTGVLGQGLQIWLFQALP